MITIFNREEILSTFSMEQKTLAVNLLEEKNVRSRVIVHNRSKEGMGSRNRIGTFGQRLDMMYEYQIFVYRNDAELAKEILRSKLHI